MTTPSVRRRKVLRRVRITGWTALTSLLVTIIGFLTWFHIVLPADRDATLEVYTDSRFEVRQEAGVIVMDPVDAGSEGVLFFPGAKVDPYSYLYPLADVAGSGVTVIIMDPLMNMALFDQRSIETLTASAPGVTTWTLSGHSLGGVRACMLADHSRVDRLVLLASFCANDLTSTSLDVIMVEGDQDGLIDRAAIEDSTALLPQGHVTRQTIEGANHASFGTYGPQPSDGESTLTREDMRAMLTEIFLAEGPEH